eukprot:TRINITY_DN2038_c0_g1_i1.p1 TRINITY_DN2038_c0_g1~~TRINITY_DN2038_c0_g1_i1.p1  ORF type:complete len:162 (+),score=31.29 TRINITY_DN2038_c0_g1_i1:10-495(+)
MAQHNFVKTYFSSPTWCTYCKEFIWGVHKKQGYKCSACGGIAHSKCRTTSGSCSKSPVPVQVQKPATGGNSVSTTSNTTSTGAINTAGSQPAATPAVAAKPASRYAQAMFDFPPESEHELELKVGDKIEVLQQEGEWWFGVLGDGRRGYFPFNYVEKIGNW